MGCSAGLRCRPGLAAGIKLARLLEAPEAEIAQRVRLLERGPLFERLVSTGVVSVEPYTDARFAVRRFAGYALRAGDSGLSEALDGNSEEVQLMLRIGRERFEGVFLRDERLTDRQRASACGITEVQARKLRGLVDRLYIQGEFAGEAQPGAPVTVFSSVAGIAVEAGKPILAFFHRDIWKGRYRIDADRRAALIGALRPDEVARAEALLRELELVDRRKSTLYKILEIIVEEQQDYFVSRDRDRRRPLLQCTVAARVGVSGSVVNRMVSNKAVEMPWGIEVPLKELLPSRKRILSGRVFSMKAEHPKLTDDEIREKFHQRYGVALSRALIFQYRTAHGALVPRADRTFDTCAAEV
jgi:predicted nucleic acid-binding OB-fold protein